MPAIREQEIQLFRDKEFEEEVGPYYGNYLGSFVSARGQVRADLFDTGRKVVAHISFPTGLSASSVEDRYVAILEDYAAAQGFGDRFDMIYADR